MDALGEPGRRDQAAALSPLPAAPPFKFEARRVAIDWRLLHGVDTDSVVRRVDLDTLEALLPLLTWGDLGAEPPSALGGGSGAKLLRLAQLLLEYLLYVQDSLAAANEALAASRSKAVAAATAAGGRVTALSQQLREARREARRARRTLAAYEVLAAAAGGGGPAAALGRALAATGALRGAASDKAATPSPQQPAGVSAAEHQLLQCQLAELTEVLAVAGCEAAALRSEREELAYQVRHLADSLAARTGAAKTGQRHFSPGRPTHAYSRRPGSAAPLTPRSCGAGVPAAAAAAWPATDASQQQQQQQQQGEGAAQLVAQVQQLQDENAALRRDLADAAAAQTGAADAIASLQAQLADARSQLENAQGELRQRNASLAALQAANRSLSQAAQQAAQQVAAQQAAEAAAGDGGDRAAGLHLAARNAELALEVERLALALEAAQEAAAQQQQQEQLQQQCAAAAPDSEEDAASAAERLLLQPHGGVAASTAAGDSEQLLAGWRGAAELERLRQERQQLQAQVAPLQQQLQQLQQLVGDSRALRPAPAPPGVAVAGWASASSSGPHAELTAADLAAAAGGLAAAAAAAADGAQHPVQQAQAQAQAGAAAQGEVLEECDEGGASGGASGEAWRPPVVTRMQPAAPVAQAPTPRVSQAAVEGVAPATQQQQAQAAAPAASAGDTAGAHAALPSHAAAAAPGASAPGSPRGGAIPAAAVAALRGVVAALGALPAEVLASEYKEATDDWEVPFNLEQHEKDAFAAALPHALPRQPGVLMAAPHTAEALAAARPELLASLNRQLDGQLASFGIHPGRTGLSQLEFMAAMRLLSERRAAWSARLPAQQQDAAEVLRLALLLHPYNALQEVLAGEPPDPEDGKRRLPGPVAPVLVSAVQPPAPPPPATGGAMLPPGPGAIRVSTRGTGGSAGGAGASPAAAARYQGASGLDSEDEAGPGSSPTRGQLHARGSPGGMGSLPSPGSSSASGFSPMSAALQAIRHAPLPAVQQQQQQQPAVLSARPAAAAAVAAQQQLGQQAATPPPAAIAAAVIAAKQFLVSSFDESDEAAG